MTPSKQQKEDTKRKHGIQFEFLPPSFGDISNTAKARTMHILRDLLGISSSGRIRWDSGTWGQVQKPGIQRPLVGVFFSPDIKSIPLFNEPGFRPPAEEELLEHEKLEYEKYLKNVAKQVAERIAKEGVPHIQYEDDAVKEDIRNLKQVCSLFNGEVSGTFSLAAASKRPPE